MTTAKKQPICKILLNLDEDPKVQFFPWELEVRNVAASMCKTITPRGLLSVLLTDEQWNAYSANITVDPQGLVVIAPRFTPPQLHRHKRHHDQCRALCGDGIQHQTPGVVHAWGRPQNCHLREPTLRRSTNCKTLGRRFYLNEHTMKDFNCAGINLILVLVACMILYVWFSMHALLQ